MSKPETDDERRAREWAEIYRYVRRYEQDFGPAADRAAGSFTAISSFVRGAARRWSRAPNKPRPSDPPSPDRDA